MASKAGKGQEEEMESGDAPLLDLNEASVKKLIARATKRGYITYDELNAALPQDQMSSEQIEDVMSALNDMGIELTLDNFGTGYSSLAYLKRIPVGKLKIDRSFVRNLDVDPDDRAIASTILSMGRSLRLKVLAEGVETAEQYEILRGMGCELVQGHLFGRPLPPEEFVAFLEQQGLIGKKG